jgi:hypothetical protein
VAADLEFLQAASSTANLTTFTFAGQNLGTAAADRVIVVGVSARAGGTGTTVSTVTVDGESCPVRVQQSSTPQSSIAAIASVALPAGTTGDVVVTFSAAAVRCGVQLYRMVGGEAVPTATYQHTNDATDPTASMDVPAGGAALGVAVANGGGQSATWAGLTEDYDAVLESGSTHSSASGDFAGAQTGLTVTCDFSGSLTANSGAFASFGPTTGGGSIVPLVAHHRRMMGRG